MILATEYKLTDGVSIPLVQSEFKRYIEDLTNGALYVDLRPGGELGVGAALANRVAAGAVHAAQYSLANFAAYVPAIDIINIPYWCGDNQRYANLVTSDSWAREIEQKLAARGFKVLFYFSEDCRTVAMNKVMAPKVIRTPTDLRGVRIRVPNSKVMIQFYRLAGAEPVVVPWDETWAAVQRGVADALDPAVTTLYTVGFQKLLSSISYIASVADAQVYACNRDWYCSLPRHLRRALDEASERSMAESFTRVSGCRAYSLAQMEKAGVRSYTPTAAELVCWAETTGEQRPEWEPFKVELLGSLDAFDRLKTAANNKGKYTVDDN
jgi:TRAP-type C4-dicarboxylate transport system substrate-binding protein